MVRLHDAAMRDFVQVWKAAKSVNLEIPQTGQPKYASLDALLVHVLSCAKKYLDWLCEVLDLPDPGIEPTPHRDVVEDRVDRYLEQLLSRWKTPLAEVSEERFFDTVQKTWWNVHYCADAMLEHAVMHPTRHRFQLQELMARRSSS
jgi:uncharacterized damage-inducible protein DinB